MSGIRGVYIITNTANKKKFVGISQDLEREWEVIKADLFARKGNRQMVEDFHLFGEKSFQFDIVMVSDNEKELLRREGEESYKNDVWLTGYNTTVTLNYHNMSDEDLAVYKTSFFSFVKQIKDGKYLYKDLVEVLGLSTGDLEVILDNISQDEMQLNRRQIRLLKLASNKKDYYVEIKSIS